jgi:hypothetical protein
MKINTYCSGCLFIKDGDNKGCYFDIPNILKDVKIIEDKDGYNYIHEYACKYCFSKSVYDSNKELHEIDIVQAIRDNSLLKYYLVVDLKNNDTNVEAVCSTINKLDIKPKYISFINRNKDLSDSIAKQILKNIYDTAKWKLHNFVLDKSLQECITISLDTNINKVDSKIFTVYIPENPEKENELNDRINFFHFETSVKQNPFNAVIADLTTLDGIFIDFNSYKYLLLNDNPDILKAMASATDRGFKYIQYEL